MITKFIKFNENYIHTNQDKIDDMKYIEEFAEKFENKFEFRLNLNIGKSQFRTYIGYGAEKYYNGEIIINNLKYYKKQKKIKYLVNIDTLINPFGFINDDINRSFKINFHIINEKRIPDFYERSRNIEDVLEKFDTYVLQQLGKKHLSLEEIEKNKILKKTKKYNI